MKIKNPKLTLTVGGDVRGSACELDDNNELVIIDDASNGTYELVALRRYDNYSGEYIFLGVDFDQNVELVDAVNCTLEQYRYIYITDPTKDASCTVESIGPIGPIPFV